MPLGPEPSPLEVALTAFEEDRADEVNADTLEEAELLDIDLLTDKLVALAELLEGVKVGVDDPLTDVVNVTFDPVEKYPQPLPAQEIP